MPKIIMCDNINVLTELPHILKYASEQFQDMDIVSYAVLDDEKRINFILRHNSECIYLKNEDKCIKFYHFSINENYLLDGFVAGKYDIYNRNPVLMINRENLSQLVLDVVKREEPSDEGYDGIISFRQYNPENDISLEMQYQQMIRTVNGRHPIYECNLNNLDYVFIDKNASRNKPLTFGPVINREYFARFDLSYDSVGYQRQKIKEILLNGTFEDKRNIVKYYTIKLITPRGNYITLFPFGNSYEKDDIIEIIRKYGFETSVPEELLSAYNGNNSIFNEILELTKQISEVELNNRNDMKLLLIAKESIN